MKLIVNADDFALTLGVTKGIIKGMKEGIITDTSIFANADYFYESIQLAEENGITSMGVHLTITFSKPVLEASKVKSIVDGNGDFFRKSGLIPKTYKKEEVRSELRAQIEKFLSTGLKLNHLDTHHGFSVWDSEMMDVVTSLAKEYKVPMRRDVVLSKDLRIKEKFFSSSIVTTDNVYISSTNENYIVSVLEEHKDSDCTIEFAGHPGFVDNELLTISSVAHEREKDLELFMSKKLMKYIKDNNIELISYSELN
ncbi:MAG: hypothetical protein ACFWTY_09915 [Shouchella clausii]|jgi:chitin disaccharide deacetylase